VILIKDKADVCCCYLGTRLLLIGDKAAVIWGQGCY